MNDLVSLEQNLPAQKNVDAERAMKEVEGAIVLAKKFPRNDSVVFDKLIKACQRPLLAESAMYSYPRGGEVVTGPSIRLAEVMAQAMGNMTYGVRELSNENGFSVIETYAWDLESNVRSSKTFKVEHARDTKQGKRILKDSRDIYEVVASSGARRLRACILNIIPQDIVEACVEQCEKTLRSDDKESAQDKIRKLVVAFSSIGVSVQMLEKKLGHAMDITNLDEVVELRKIYSSLKEGVAKREDFFLMEEKKEETKTSLIDKIKG